MALILRLSCTETGEGRAVIDLQTDSSTGTVSLWLQADRALGWMENARHIRLHLLFTLIPAAGFIARGLWPIAVFLLLASALLGISTWCALRRLSWRERITLTHDAVRFQRGRTAPQQGCACARRLARLRVLRGPTPWHAPVVLLNCADRHWEVGHALGPGERRRLIRLLAESGLSETVRPVHTA
jgi:uncharacterized membrane protein